MASIRFNQVDFSFESPYAKVFERLTLTVESHWKTALVGNNGRGKTTLLALMDGQLSPTGGRLEVPLDTALYPYRPSNPQQKTLDIVRDSIAPFNQWERQMEDLLAKADEASIQEYGNILDAYQESRGYEIDALIQKEMPLVGLDAELLERNFATLSGGEQTRILIIAMFLKMDHFLLIDEPTNHLDMHGRSALGNYFAGKDGFVVASHDRCFLDACTDHVVSINRNDIRVNQGNYSVWKRQMDLEEASERRRHESLKREIRQMEIAASKRRSWSQQKEKEKIGGGAAKGFIAHRAAKMMKRALGIEHRLQDAVEDKKALLKNVEKER
ncbi:MAG: ABC-F family ATP-binding cassette domain-containing protein, partial [Proteobacteria bacterium]|nr:ABC-F family ATP-binding cassette domain-containing protein [Pseudomonadota bacterium]